MSKLSHSNDDTMNQLESLRLKREGVDLSDLPCCEHASDCAVHNDPAYPAGPCDCGYEEKWQLRNQLANAIRCCNDPANCNNEPDAKCPTKLEWLALRQPPAVPADVAGLVDRFLQWPLPTSVCADPCATMRDYPHRRYGTSLLTADEARQMLEYVLGNKLGE